MWIKSRYDGNLVNLDHVFNIKLESNYYCEKPFRVTAYSHGACDPGTDLRPVEVILYAGTEKQCEAYYRWLEHEMRSDIINDTFFVEVDEEEEDVKSDNP